MQGKTINGFELKRRLGVGGMAEVWYAENRIGKKAAVKLLLHKFCVDENVKSRFYTEAKVMVDLNHPNIRQVYDYGELDARPAIVMEYLEGEDLKAKLKQGQHFTEEELERWWNQMVAALNYTHGKGIVHRDIKPGNIFVDTEGNIKLLDFGIAKVRESISTTQTGQKLGTLMYMSPEQVKDSKHIDYHTDIYSLAVTFVHLITGKRPYDSDTSSDFEISEQIVYKPLDLSAVPMTWRNFLAPYLEKDPEKRPELKPFEAVSAPQSKVDDDETEAPTSSNGLENKDLNMAIPQSKETDGNNIVPSKKPTRIPLWITLGVAAVALLFVILMVLKSGRTDNHLPIMPIPYNDTEAYQACQTVADYRAYMRDYGRNALHYAEAQQFVKDFVADSTAKAEEDAAYGRCSTITACESYLQAYPQGRYVAEVKARKADLESAEYKDELKKEESAYRKCTTIAACESYLKTYPQGQYVQEVKAKKAELEAQAEVEKNEDEAYRKCTTVAACDSYLKTYPQGRYVQEVRTKKAQLEAQAQQQFQQSLTGTANGHEWVDLGLPSGTLWATCNIGASKPEGYGNYYAWGETSRKSTYNWSIYKHANGASDKLTKYCNKSSYGNNGFTDNLTILQTGDDPATSWGSGWRMPTEIQWEELTDNTTHKWTTQNGVKGCLFTGWNGQTLFLPAAGDRWDLQRDSSAGSNGYYWSKSLDTYYPSRARYLYFSSDNCGMYGNFRYIGFTVRPVYER